MADMLVPFAEPVAELLAAGTSVELLAADMSVAYSSEPVVGKSAVALAADIVAEPVIEAGMPVVAASVEQEPELEADNLAVLVAEQELVPVADMLVPSAELLAADMAAAYSFEPVAGKSAAVLGVDLLGQIVVPSF